MPKNVSARELEIRKVMVNGMEQLKINYIHSLVMLNEKKKWSYFHVGSRECTDKTNSYSHDYESPKH